MYYIMCVVDNYKPRFEFSNCSAHEMIWRPLGLVGIFVVAAAIAPFLTSIMPHCAVGSCPTPGHIPVKTFHVAR